MSRHIKQIDDNISIAYGYDRPCQSYFLTVYDSRLEEDYETDPSGEGIVEEYATDRMFLLTPTGKHVNRGKFLDLLERYDVNEAHCQDVALDIPIRD